MHEVITLQFGQQANYIGTHYWNIQESYFSYAGQDESPVNHDISFRAGLGADGQDTYTPRALLYDLKGAFGTLRRENALYELQQQDLTTDSAGWSGRTIPLRLPAIAASPYQQALDAGVPLPQLTPETVRFWSDYNHVFYHPKSIVQLNEYEVNSSLMPFERYGTGEELFAELDREHDLLDRDLRPFLEECDQLQGLQVLTGIDDAWGGFAAKYLERVSDELGKGCRWVFGLQDGQRTSRERQLLRVTNTAQATSTLASTASLHIPLTSVPTSLPPYTTLETSSRWHSSALQSALVESVTLPTRLRLSELGRATFDQLETVLNNEGKRGIAAAELSADDPSILKPMVNGEHDSRMANGITNGHRDAENDGNDIDFSTDPTSLLSPGARPAAVRKHIFSRVQSLRGHYKTSDEIAQANADARDRYFSGARTGEYQTKLLFPLLSSTSAIFNFKDRPERLAIRASLSTSTQVASRIRNLEGVARRTVAIDEREALCDSLMTLSEEYEEGWSDDDEDGLDDD